MAGSKQKVRSFKRTEAEALYTQIAASISLLKLVSTIATWHKQADKLRETTIALAHALEDFEGFVSWATIRDQKSRRTHQVPLFPDVHPDLLVPSAPLIILASHTPDLRLTCHAALRTAPDVLHPFETHRAEELGDHRFIVTAKREYGERGLRAAMRDSA